MSLKEYQRKRDFKRTPEPKARGARGGKRRFVIQKHDATRLHYDFRLEIDGTLKSWAVPKGIPFAKGEKRLAVQVEDHPVSYINFEGTIPQGQYGGGTVMVWDQGTFETTKNTSTHDLESGKLHVALHGKKLQGEWYLVRLRDENQWLLIRGGDSLRPVSKKADDTSALSGKSMKQLADNGKVWQSKPRETKTTRRFLKKKVKPAGPPPKFVEPMKARLMENPPAGDWIYEVKFDGFRALALKHGNSIELWSRNEKDFTQKFPEVTDALRELDVSDAILDGEIVALDKKGRSSFQLLQAYEMGEERPPIFFYAFDLLRLNGRDLKNQPLSERKRALAEILKTAPDAIRHSAALGSDAKKLLQQARRLGLEGLIGKRADSVYEPGRRSGAWIKLKLQREQEFVIGGYTNPEGSRKYFGALLVGFFENKKLRFAGKVGTGFNHALLKSLHGQFEKIARADCPFANLPEPRAGRYQAGITAAEMKRCHWLKPVLVCQVRFSEWTRDGKLRQPVFLGLREDKNAAEVAREKAA